MLGDALEYPVRGEDAPTTILVGGLLPLLSVMIAFVGVALAIVVIGLAVLPLALVPGIVLLGYYVAVLRAVTAGDPTPPRFRDWRRLFVDGLRFLGITVVYAIPALVLFGLFLGVVAASGTTTADLAAVAVAAAAVVIGGLAVCYLLAFTYVRPLALANFARQDRFGAAFDLETVRIAGGSSAYALAWLLATVVWLVGATLESSLSVVLIGFFVGFYADVVRYYLYGRGLRTALEGADTTDDGEQTADTDGEGENESERDREERPTPRAVFPEIEEPETFAARTRSVDHDRGWTDWETEQRE